VVFLLPLHAPVLKPNLDLPLGEGEGVGDLNASTAGEVSVEVELFLELEGLVAGVRLAGTLLVEPVICTVTTYYCIGQYSKDI